MPFVEDSGDGDYNVVFHPDPDGFEEREPDEERSHTNEPPACRVELREWLSIPGHHSPALGKVLTSDTRYEYAEPYFDYPTPPKGSHQILGHAGPIQSDPSPPGKKSWSLLTQFGPDDELELEACDGGTWYFMTPTADLKKGKFGETYMEFQTG